MRKRTKPHLGTTLAVWFLRWVYWAPSAEEVFRRAYHECVSEKDPGCSATDFRLYFDGSCMITPAYIRRACWKRLLLF